MKNLAYAFLIVIAIGVVVFAGLALLQADEDFTFALAGLFAGTIPYIHQMLERRASTPNADPRFARLAADLIDEVCHGREPSRVPASDPVPLYGFSIDGVGCTPECG